jgi:pimeloyl-ACP methyl ester carboxylesterase
LGHSSGGVVAALLAQTRPDLVRRLVLFEPALRGMLCTSPEGEKFIQDATKSPSGALARLQAGEDPLAIARSTFDKDRPGTFDSLPELRRRILTDNARLMGPWETNKPLLNVRITCG